MLVLLEAIPVPIAAQEIYGCERARMVNFLVVPIIPTAPTAEMSLQIRHHELKVMKRVPAVGQAAKPKRRVYKRDGLQLVIPGAEHISTKEYIARMSEKPITPRKGQIGLQGTALFGRIL